MKSGIRSKTFNVLELSGRLPSMWEQFVQALKSNNSEDFAISPENESEKSECLQLEIAGLIKKRTAHRYSLTDVGLRKALIEIGS